MALLVKKHGYFEKEANHSKITEIIAVKTLTCSNNSVGWYCCRKTTDRNLCAFQNMAKHDVRYDYAGMKARQPCLKKGALAGMAGSGASSAGRLPANCFRRGARKTLEEL